MIRVRTRGDFKNTTRFLNRVQKLDFESVLKHYGEEGVKALSSATPVATGKTAASWNYEIDRKDGQISIYWTNSNVVDGVRIAVILEFGHGTGWGSYVQGRHYIEPAIRPVFDSIAEAAWKEVRKN